MEAMTFSLLQSVCPTIREVPVCEFIWRGGTVPETLVATPSKTSATAPATAKDAITAMAPPLPLPRNIFPDNGTLRLAVGLQTSELLQAA
jgi:hypothetical protein